MVICSKCRSCLPKPKLLGAVARSGRFNERQRIIDATFVIRCDYCFEILQYRTVTRTPRKVAIALAMAH